MVVLRCFNKNRIKINYTPNQGIYNEFSVRYGLRESVQYFPSKTIFKAFMTKYVGVNRSNIKLFYITE